VLTPPRDAPDSGDVHVRYRLTGSIDERLLQDALALLSPDERARHDRFRLDVDRREFAIAHALLRTTTLSEFAEVAPLDWRFDAGPHGKPALAPGVSPRPLSFNLSHARGLVACVVTAAQPRDGGRATVDVGLDVELVTRATDWRGIAARYFSPLELAQIDRAAAADRPTRFFEIWTLKEAFAKALGLGLSQALDASVFEVEDGAVAGCTLPAGLDPAAWRFALYRPAPDHRLAVAVSDGSPRRWRIDVRAAVERER
jgi:4'-phosphopantetheinyl transferase